MSFFSPALSPRQVSHLLLWEPTTAKATGTVTAEGLLASEPAPGCEHAGVLIVSLPGSFSGGSLAAAAEGGRQWAAPAGKVRWTQSSALVSGNGRHFAQ